MSNEIKRFSLNGPIFFVIAIIICEVILKLGGYPSWRAVNALISMPAYHFPDQELGWKNKPGKLTLSDQSRVIAFTANNEGARFSAPEENPSSQKFIFIGDSYVQGYGLSDQETFAWKLQEQFPKFAFINLGTGGYGTYQAYLSMQSYIKKHPYDKSPTFIYLFNVFHELRNVGDTAWLTILEPPPTDSGFHFPYCILDGAKNLDCTSSQGIIPSSLSRWSRTAALIEDITRRIFSYSRLRKKRDVTKALLLKAQSTAKSIGAQFKVVLFDIDEESKAEYQKFFEQNTITSLDCVYLEKNDERYVFPDGHPNTAMNLKMSECIKKLLP